MLEAVIFGIHEVYPRPRGGAMLLKSSNGFDSGLSPPTRGNPHVSPYHLIPFGSIPAHAGEPPAFP